MGIVVLWLSVNVPYFCLQINRAIGFNNTNSLIVITSDWFCCWFTAGEKCCCVDTCCVKSKASKTSFNCMMVMLARLKRTIISTHHLWYLGVPYFPATHWPGHHQCVRGQPAQSNVPSPEGGRDQLETGSVWLPPPDGGRGPSLL